MHSFDDLFEISNIYLAKSSFALYDLENAIKGGLLEFSSTAEISEDETKENLMISLEIGASATREDKINFELSCKYACVLRVNQKSKRKVSKLDDRQKTEYGVRILYSLIRQNLMSSLSQAGLGGIKIPVSVKPFLESDTEEVSEEE